MKWFNRKNTIEEVFDVEIHSHSLYFYGKKKKKKRETLT